MQCERPVTARDISDGVISLSGSGDAYDKAVMRLAAAGFVRDPVLDVEHGGMVIGTVRGLNAERARVGLPSRGDDPRVYSADDARSVQAVVR